MITPPYPIIIRDQQLWLSHHRCIFWEDQKILLMSDTHFGKTGHFRKEGIGLPQGVYSDDLKRLIGVIQYFQPEKLIVIGDLFHSHHNKEIEQFDALRRSVIDIPIGLVQGNHDVLPQKLYRELKIECYGQMLEMQPFAFTHDRSDLTPPKDLFSFSGHLHPGIQIKSKARQSIQLPCFYFKENYAYLPAFSLFTGTSKIRRSSGDTVFMISKNSLIPVK